MTILTPSQQFAQQRAIQIPLQKIIEGLFERCFQTKRYRQVIGIAVEARRFDIIRRAILRADADEKKEGKARKDGVSQMEELLDYLLTISMELIQDLEVRQQLLRLILGLLRDVPSPDVFSIAKCIVYLDGHSEASKLLVDLVETGGPQHLAEAYQIAFDIYDNSSQDFLKKVREGLPKEPDEKPTEADKMDEDKAEDAKETDGLLKDTEEQTEMPLSANPEAVKQKPLSPSSQKAFGYIAEILQGVKSIALNLEFLHRNNHANMAILKKLKDSLEVRFTILLHISDLSLLVGMSTYAFAPPRPQSFLECINFAVIMCFRTHTRLRRQAFLKCYKKSSC